MAKLGDVSDIYLGLTHTPNYVENGVPFLSVKDISSGCISFSNCHYISKEEYNGLPDGAKPHVGDMLFCRVGTIGKPVIIDNDIPYFGTFVSLGFLRLKDSSPCSMKYLYYWMNSDSFIRQVKSNVKGASQVNLNTGWLKNFTLPIFSSEIEQKIINLLDSICELIDLHLHHLTHLAALVTSRFIEMFGDESQFARMQLDDNVEEMFIGPFGSSLKNECFVTKADGYCMVYEQKHAIRKTMDVETRYVEETKYKELQRFTVVGGDIIVSCRGTIGETFVVPDEAPIGIMHPSIMKIRLKKSVYDKVFFNHLLQEVLLRHENEANGSGVKMAITASALGKELFIVPSMKLQNEFTTFVEQVDKSKFEIQKSLEKLETLKKSLMQQYFG